MTMGKRIRDRRKAMRLSQVQLAKRAGVSQPTISDYENDVPKDNRASVLMRIAAALETSIDYLAHGIGPVSLVDAESDLDTLTSTFNKLSQSERAAVIATAKALLATKGE